MALGFPTDILRRIFTTPYRPDPELRTFVARAQTQSCPQAEVTVAALDATESARFFGVPLARRGIQPVYLRIVNRGDVPLRLLLLRIAPNYFTPLEAAGLNHFSIAKRLSAFGLMGVFVFNLLLLLVPFKLITAYFANQRMDDFFRTHAFRMHPIAPGGSSEGFAFTPLDVGTKAVHVYLLSAHHSLSAAQQGQAASPDIEFHFSMAVPGLSADYLRRDFQTLERATPAVVCDAKTLGEHLAAMPATTTDRHGKRHGDPANLTVIGEFETLLSAFTARWDESESITLKTCWKTLRAFLLGSQYRYSPVSALHLFGRSQDFALQRSRQSINERLHLRLWLTPLKLHGQSVWFGQVSRDIGVRFTTKTWNLTTHRVDPDVDEARDYVLEDLLQAHRVEAAAYVEGVGACDATHPRHNLTGDPYFTDGKRVVILLSAGPTTPRFVAWS